MNLNDRKFSKNEVNFRPGEKFGEVCAACANQTGTPDFPGTWCFLVEGVRDDKPAWTCDAFSEATARRLMIEDIQKAGIE